MGISDVRVRKAWREWLPTLPADDRDFMYRNREDEPAAQRTTVPGAARPRALIITAPESLPSLPPKPVGKRRVQNEAVRVVRDGREEWRELGNDEQGIRAALEIAAAGTGFTVDELIAPTPRGRLTLGEQLRRSALAGVVTSLRARGAMLEAIGAVIGRSKARVLDLERTGGQVARAVD